MKKAKLPAKKTKVVAAKRRQKMESCQYEWLEFWPRDLIFEGSHFVFILENEKKKAVLPIRFPIQSAELVGVASIPSLWKKSLQFTVEHLFSEWQVEFLRCTFIEHRMGHHKVRLFYKKNGQTHSFDKDLETVLGLCLELQIPFYATRAYIKDIQHSQHNNEIFLLNQQWTDGRQKYLI